MVGMETLRCPTCVTLLPDPEARRCPACHSKLRKRRRRPIVLGESNRLSGRSLPVDVELRTRAEARYEAYVPAKAAEPEPIEALLEFTPPEPLAEPEPEPGHRTRCPHRSGPQDRLAACRATARRGSGGRAAACRGSGGRAAVDRIATRRITPGRSAAEQMAAARSGDDRPHDRAEPNVRPRVSGRPRVPDDLEFPDGSELPSGMIDLTAEQRNEDKAPSSRQASGWQPVPSRGSSPLDGNLDEMLAELHRKAPKTSATRVSWVPLRASDGFSTLIM